MENKTRIGKILVIDMHGKKVAEVRKARYIMIPVDPQTKANVIRLCIANGGNARSQGAMVKRLVDEALEKMKVSKGKA